MHYLRKTHAQFANRNSYKIQIIYEYECAMHSQNYSSACRNTFTNTQLHAHKQTCI